MAELFRQRDDGDWTFLSCLAPDGRVQLLMRPHAVDRDGSLSRERAHVYRFSPVSVRTYSGPRPSSRHRFRVRTLRCSRRAVSLALSNLFPLIGSTSDTPRTP